MARGLAMAVGVVGLSKWLVMFGWEAVHNGAAKGYLGA